MRDDFQFAAVAAVAVAAIVGYVVLAVTNSGALGFHDVVVLVTGGMLGYAGKSAVNGK